MDRALHCKHQRKPHQIENKTIKDNPANIKQLQLNEQIIIRNGVVQANTSLYRFHSFATQSIMLRTW